MTHRRLFKDLGDGASLTLPNPPLFDEDDFEYQQSLAEGADHFSFEEPLCEHEEAGYLGEGLYECYDCQAIFERFGEVRKDRGR